MSHVCCVLIYYTSACHCFYTRFLSAVLQAQIHIISLGLKGGRLCFVKWCLPPSSTKDMVYLIITCDAICDLRKHVIYFYVFSSWLFYCFNLFNKHILVSCCCFILLFTGMINLSWILRVSHSLIYIALGFLYQPTFIIEKKKTSTRILPVRSLLSFLFRLYISPCQYLTKCFEILPINNSLLITRDIV